MTGVQTCALPISLHEVEAGVAEIERAMEGRTAGWGANLIHSPAEPELEAKVAELYLRRGVCTVEASAFLQLTPSVVRLAASGLRVEDQRIVRPRRVVAKVSRPEVARPFMSAAPADILAHLRDRGQLTEAEAAGMIAHEIGRASCRERVFRVV